LENLELPTPSYLVSQMEFATTGTTNCRKEKEFHVLLFKKRGLGKSY